MNIGIIDKNPCTIDGTIGIMDDLHKYVARREDGTLHVIPTHGDGMSVERMTDAKRVRAAGFSDVNRLEGLEQTPQEFHHRGLLMQVLIIENDCNTNNNGVMCNECI